MTVRVHYDGAVLVPDEPLDLPVGEPLEVDVRPLRADIPYSELSIEERLRRLERFSGRIKGVSIPDEALRRENLYGERQ